MQLADKTESPAFAGLSRIRQRIESIVDTLKDQLLLEHHGGRTPAGLLARVTARILALCACINLNQRLGHPSRELTAYTELTDQPSSGRRHGDRSCRGCQEHGRATTAPHGALSAQDLKATPGAAGA